MCVEFEIFYEKYHKKDYQVPKLFLFQNYKNFHLNLKYLGIIYLGILYS